MRDSGFLGARQGAIEGMVGQAQLGIAEDQVHSQSASSRIPTIVLIIGRLVRQGASPDFVRTVLPEPVCR